MSGTPFNALNFGSVYIWCTSAPSAGTIQGSPDNANDYNPISAVYTTGSGFSTTSTVTAAQLYVVVGQQWVEVSGLTGGACWIGGGQ